MVTAAEIINARRLIEGPRDMFRSVSVRRYQWTKEMTRRQEANRWFPSQVNLSRDSLGLAKLPKGAQIGYKRALAFLSNLDAIQCDNLAENLYPHITDPHVQQCMATQVAEEWIHVETYSNMIETVVKGDDLEIYNMYQVVPELGAKNAHVIAQGKSINDIDLRSFGENFVKAIVSNLVLEGVYFFSGFTSIYACGRAANGGMTGSVDSVKYIQRDEDEHTWMFKNMWHDLRTERPELFTPQVLDECRSIIVDGVNRECSWGKYVTEEGIPLLNEHNLGNYIKCLGETIATDIGLGGLWKNQTHELGWAENYRMNKGQKNFFEGRVGTYRHDVPTFTGSRRNRSNASISDMMK